MNRPNDPDPQEKELWRRFLRASPGSPSPGGCPDEGLLAAYVEGNIPDPQKDRFEAHLSRCRSCLAAVRDLRAWGQSADAVPGSVGVRARDLVTVQDEVLAPSGLVEWLEERFGGLRGIWAAGGYAFLLICISVVALRMGQVMVADIGTIETAMVRIVAPDLWAGGAL